MSEERSPEVRLEALYDTWVDGYDPEPFIEASLFVLEYVRRSAESEAEEFKPAKVVDAARKVLDTFNSIDDEVGWYIGLQEIAPQFEALANWDYGNFRSPTPGRGCLAFHTHLVFKRFDLPIGAHRVPAPDRVGNSNDEVKMVDAPFVAYLAILIELLGKKWNARRIADQYLKGKLPASFPTPPELPDPE